MINEIKKFRVIVITGHYGSGKTEIALNLAYKLKRETDKPVVIADLDIMNPYFRSREQRESLEKAGIKIIGGSIEDTQTGVPSLSGEVQAQLALGEGFLILDVGGDPQGAQLLGRYPVELDSIREHKDLVHLFILNAYRPETPNAELAEAMLRQIESFSGLNIDAIVSNSHLLKATTPQEITTGWELGQELSQKVQIPLLAYTLPKGVEKPSQLPLERAFTLEIVQRLEWMS